MQTDVYFHLKCVMSKEQKLDFCSSFESAVEQKLKEDGSITLTQGVFTIIKSNFVKSKNKCVHVRLIDAYEPLGTIKVNGWEEIDHGMLKVS